jgi:hypothetical protein
MSKVFSEIETFLQGFAKTAWRPLLFLVPEKTLKPDFRRYVLSFRGPLSPRLG